MKMQTKYITIDVHKSMGTKEVELKMENPTKVKLSTTLDKSEALALAKALETIAKDL